MRISVFKRALAAIFAALLIALCGCAKNHNPSGQIAQPAPSGRAEEIQTQPDSQSLADKDVEALALSSDEEIFLPAEEELSLTPYEAFIALTGNFPDNDAEVRSIIDEGLNYRLAIHYPQLNAGWFDRPTESECLKQAEAFASLVKSVPNSGQSYEFYQEFELFRPYDTLVSINYSRYLSQPGTDTPESGHIIQNCDLIKRSEVKLWDLLDGKYLQYLSKRCLDAVLNSGTFTGDADILAGQKLNPSQKNFADFILLKDYMVFFFPNIYSWDTGEDIPPWVAVSYAELADFISRDYRFLIENLPGERENEPEKASVFLEDDLEVYGEAPQVALSFDDGPGKLTPRLLDILRENKAHATFFVLGNKVRANKDTLLRMLEEGHEIGNHTWSHKILTGQGRTIFEDQVFRTQNELSDVIGYTPKLLRPSYGAIDENVRTLTPLPIVLWSVDPEDWKIRSAEILVPAIISGVKDGDIILLHDTYESTVETAEQVLHELDGMGIRVVTVSQLLRRYGEELHPGVVYRKNPPLIPVSEG